MKGSCTSGAYCLCSTKKAVATPSQVIKSIVSLSHIPLKSCAMFHNFLTVVQQYNSHVMVSHLWHWEIGLTCFKPLSWTPCEMGRITVYFQMELYKYCYIFWWLQPTSPQQTTTWISISFACATPVIRNPLVQHWTWSFSSFTSLKINKVIDHMYTPKKLFLVFQNWPIWILLNSVCG